MRLTFLSVAIFFCLDSFVAAADAPILERVVMVSRHGIRSPTRPVEVLEALTKRRWPAWPVAPGEMTEHGARNLALMANFIRASYRRSGLLPQNGCPASDSVAVWSDAADHRTRQSGDIWADHLAPGCGLLANHASIGTVDPLFDATKTNACPIGLVSRALGWISAARQSGDAPKPDARHALEALQDVLAPGACKGDGQSSGRGVCLVPQADASSARTATAVTFARPIAEAMYLEYAQGMPANEIGWGKPVDAATIAAIMPVNESAMSILRATPSIAARRGAVMARTILSLLQGTGRTEGAPAIPRDAKVVMIAGHDSNLLYMAALMGLDWQLADQPSFTPPDGTLAFEVWRTPDTGRRTVRLRIYAQTLAQLRDATVLDAAHPANTVDVVPEACAKAAGGCELGTFAAAVERHLVDICAR